MKAMGRCHRLQWMLFTSLALLALIFAQEEENPRCNEFELITEEFSNSQPERYSCSAFPTCNGLKCSVDLFNSEFEIPEEVYSVSVWVLPCISPPSLKIAVEHPNSEEVDPINYVLSESVYVDHFGEFPLNVTILDNLEISGEMLLKIEIDNSNVGFEEDMGVLLPWTTFNIDTTQCEQSTCQAIEQAVDIATSSNFTFGGNLSCRLTPLCDGFTCQVQISLLESIQAQIVVAAKIVSCNDPPALQITIENPLAGGRDLLNELFTESATIPVASDLGLDGLDVIVTVDQLQEGLGVGVSISTELSSHEAPSLEAILDYQFFPVNRDADLCEVYSPTCLALQGVVDKADRTGIACNTTADCDGLVCGFNLLGNGALFPATAFLVPCNKPRPAVDIKILDPNNSSKVVFGRRVKDSEKISFFGFEIDILVEHLEEDTLGFEITLVDTNSDPPTDPIQAIRYSVIPVNTSFCTTDSGVGQMKPLSVITVTMATMVVMLFSCFK